jgi:hypothetical protein
MFLQFQTPQQAVQQYDPRQPHLLPCYTFACAVYADGRVCISILHNPGDDPNGYETAAERWSPVQSVSSGLMQRRQQMCGVLTSFCFAVACLPVSCLRISCS